MIVRKSYKVTTIFQLYSPQQIHRSLVHIVILSIWGFSVSNLMVETFATILIFRRGWKVMGINTTVAINTAPLANSKSYVVSPGAGLEIFFILFNHLNRKQLRQ